MNSRYKFVKIGILFGFFILLFFHFRKVKKTSNTIVQIESSSEPIMSSSEKNTIFEVEQSVHDEVEGSTIFIDENDVEDTDIEEVTQELAKSFVSAFHKRSVDYNHVEAVEQFVTLEYFDRLNENPERQTLNREQQIVKEMFVYATGDYKTSKHITWCVMVYGDYISYKGDIEASEDLYLVTLEFQKNSGEWRVIGSWMNVAQ